jgi:hypothetical protein
MKVMLMPITLLNSPAPKGQLPASRYFSVHASWFLGVALIVWAIVVAVSAWHRYGAAAGQYWWFCNIALFGTGWAYVFRDRDLAASFLTIALYTQTVWIADNLGYLILGRSFLGLVDVIYAPEYPLDAFLLGHYHFFTIPLCLLALGSLPSGRRSCATKVALLNPLIFGISYLFPIESNINCIHKSCLPAALRLSGINYSIGFWFGCFIVHLGLAIALDRKTRSPSWPSIGTQERLQKLAVMALLAALILSFWVSTVKIKQLI